MKSVRILALPQGAAEIGPIALSPPGLTTGWPGKKSDEMFCDANRAHARSAAAMRNAEGFMQVQMANIRANISGTGQANLCVHVRAVHVNLPAVLVNDLANFANAFLKHAMRRRISNHQA